jgi:hypothetical protein
MADINLAGGGGAIYEDGDPVSFQLEDQEEFTVPDGETWVGELVLGNLSNDTGAGLGINGVTGVMAADGRSTETMSVVLTGGDTVLAGFRSSKASFSGWSV